MFTVLCYLFHDAWLDQPLLDLPIWGHDRTPSMMEFFMHHLNLMLRADHQKGIGAFPDAYGTEEYSHVRSIVSLGTILRHFEEASLTMSSRSRLRKVK